MTFAKLSAKQKTVFKWCYNSDYKALICDGAVRSGKTICMITSFILWAMRCFNGATFGICGKSVGSAERNIIMPLQAIVDITKNFKMNYTRSIHLLTIEGMGKVNYFYVFGGKDESSYMLIQGITLSGVFLDEVALMPKSFVNQAITRTLSVENSLYWFNCNPDSSEHWFFKEWIQKAKDRNALHLHFLMSDNPTLSKKQLDELLTESDCNDGKDRAADFYYILKVEIISCNEPKIICKNSDMNGVNGNDTFSPHSPKVVTVDWWASKTTCENKDARRDNRQPCF